MTNDKVVERPNRDDLKPFDECGFKESTYYFVWASCYNGNPPFKSVIYTGFKSGSYRSLFTGSECHQVDHRVRFEIISEIGSSY